MAATLAQIRAGLAANIDAVYGQSGSAGEPAQVIAYQLSSPVPPTIQVAYPDDVEYNQAFGTRGHSEWTIIVQAFAGSAFDKGAQIRLDTWVSPDGIKQAIEADRTLGGVAYDTVVMRCRGYKLYHIAGSYLLGAEWWVQVRAPN